LGIAAWEIDEDPTLNVSLDDLFKLLGKSLRLVLKGFLGLLLDLF
jgi:hypothetical protein